MTFLRLSALKAKFLTAESIVQVRVVTKERSVIEIEGPVSAKEACEIITLAMGDDAPKKRGSK